MKKLFFLEKGDYCKEGDDFICPKCFAGIIYEKDNKFCCEYCDKNFVMADLRIIGRRA